MKNKFCPPVTPSKYRSEKIIKISDPKSSNFSINNNDNSKLIEIYYDGNVVINRTACDRILICDKSANISTVELKGSDLKHAMFQLETTLINEDAKNIKNKKTAVIVYSNSPSNINSTKQVFSEKMRKIFNARVFYIKSGGSINYNDLL